MQFKSLVLLTGALMMTSAQAEMFNGGYAGVQAGYGSRSVKLVIPITGLANFDNSVTGVDYGIYAGFNSKVQDNIVVGGEVELGMGGKLLSKNLGLGYTASVDPGFNYALSARVGFLVAPNALVYVKGGYASEKVRTDVALNSTIVPTASSSGQSTGWIAGAGVEYGFTDKISGRVEYRYTKLKGSYTRNQILAGVGYNF